MKEYFRHSNMTIGVGDKSPDEKAQIILITSNSIVVGFGPNYTNHIKMTFSDVEKIWGV